VSTANGLRPLLTLLRVVAAVVAVIVFGAGIPFAWIWIGSQLQGGTAPSLAGLGVALAGIVVSYAALLAGFAWLRERISPAEGPVRHEWNRSLSAERKQGPQTNSIEDIAVAATIIVAIVCTVWFLLFGNPGVPISP
jgi:hypothetical protein